MSARTCVLIASLSMRAATASAEAASLVCASRLGATSWICASELYSGVDEGENDVGGDTGREA